MPAQFAGELAGTRKAFLGMLDKGGLADAVRNEVGDEAADDFVSRVQAAVHGFERKLQLPLTDFSRPGDATGRNPGRVNVTA